MLEVVKIGEGLIKAGGSDNAEWGNCGSVGCGCGTATGIEGHKRMSFSFVDWFVKDFL